MFGGNPTYDIENKMKRQLVGHGDYSSIANCRTKIIAVFRGIFGIVRGIPRYLAELATMLCAAPVGRHCAARN
jgi:hypothetical protein